MILNTKFMEVHVEIMEVQKEITIGNLLNLFWIFSFCTNIVFVMVKDQTSHATMCNSKNNFWIA